jgi:hypothetical protein
VAFELYDVGFTNLQTVEDDSIRSSVIITGNDSGQIMTTCFDYAIWSWPTVADSVINALEAMRRGEKSKTVQFPSGNENSFLSSSFLYGHRNVF